LLGFEDITTTEIYMHVAMGANGLGVESPLDRFPVSAEAESIAAHTIQRSRELQVAV